MSRGKLADRWAARPQVGGARRLADLQEAIAAAPLFAEVPKRHLRSLALLSRVSSYPGGAEIVRQGTEGDTFYVVLEGEARIVKGRRTIARMKPGDFFGELAIFDGEPRAASVVADGAVLCLKLEGPEFRKLLLREPRLGLTIMTAMARRLRSS
ncbi:MAG TPA: cyclic nucleotide-binding domain-containing protein [Actinomycetota bacterium]